MSTPYPLVDAPSSTLSLPHLTAQDVADETDSGSYSRGRGYRQQEAIRQPIRRGRTVSALCRGSEPDAYQVRVTLSDPSAGGEKIATYSCTCPRGGFCKHLVALLLTWIEDPDSFEVLPTIAETLADQSREDLLRLIDHLLEYEPSLEKLVDRLKPVAPIAPAAPGEARVKTVNQAAFRRKVAQVFEESTYNIFDSYSDDDYDLMYERRASRLREFVAQGIAFRDAGRIADAVVVFSTIANEARTVDEDIGDDDIVDVMFQCADVLLECLKRQATLPARDRLDAADRAMLVDALFNIWSYAGDLGWVEVEGDGLEQGEITLAVEISPGAGDREATLAALLTEDERARYETGLRDLLATTTDEYHAYRKRNAIRFLSTLRPEAFSGEDGLLNAYQGANLWGDAANVLLEMGRIDEAVVLAGHHLTTPKQTIDFANQMYARGGRAAERAIRLIDDRLWEKEGVNPRDDLAYVEWLSARYADQGLSQKAFEMERRRFKQVPAFRHYTEVKQAAMRPGLEPDFWEKTRPQLIKELTKDRLWGTLIEIYLHEDQVAEAINALKEMEKPRARREQATSGTYLDYGLYAGMGSGTYRVSVAKAAERDFPEEAIRLYRSLAESAIEGRSRPSYATAANYLVSVRNLMEAIGQEAEWQAYVAGLRDTHKRLRALKEELDAVGLR